ncbi:MAG: hypothetical protein ACLPUG_09755 [Acidimicrobiales bacterium]|jgi:hypothetical protein
MSEGHLAVGKPDEEGNFPVVHRRADGVLRPLGRIKYLEDLEKFKKDEGVVEVRYEDGLPPSGPQP